MTTSTEIAAALANAGYLAQADIETAAVLLADELAIEDMVEAFDDASRDEAEQEQMIAGASAMAEQDAALGDKRELRIDESIIRDAKGKEQVDEATRRHAEKKISAACHSAAKSLAHARLIDKADVKAVAGLIADRWKMDLN